MKRRRSFYARPAIFRGQHCIVTDDGNRYTGVHCVRCGHVELPPQADVAVYERRPSGRLVTARVYDDVQAPVEDS